MDTENKTPVASNTAPEQKPQEQAPASPTPPPASNPVPTDTKAPSSGDAKQESKPEEAATPPPSEGSATPAKRSASGMWLLIVVVAVLFGAGGFVAGQGSSKSSVKNGQESPTPTVVQGKKKVSTKISGKIRTDAHGLSYLIVDVSEYGSVKAKNHEVRYILEPQGNMEYSYTFDELNPNLSYTVVMQGCAEKDQKSTCVLSRKVVSCSGRIPGGALQQCLINGDGEADFFLDKSLVSEYVNPTGTPTPTPEPPTPTPTP
jgi:hypothetical protein